MNDSPILYLDANFISDILGRDNIDVTRFNRIMDALAKQYEIRITDTVLNEIEFKNDSGNYASAIGQPFNEWRTIPANKAKFDFVHVQGISQGGNAGELSIATHILNDPDYIDGHRDFIIASRDASYITDNPGLSEAQLFDSLRTETQPFLKNSAIGGFVTLEDYKTLSTDPYTNIPGTWHDYHSVTIDAIYNQHGISGQFDGNGDFIFEKQSIINPDHRVSGKISEADLFKASGTSQITLEITDGSTTITKTLPSGLSALGDAIGKAGVIGTFMGLGLAAISAQEAYAAGDTEGAINIISDFFIGEAIAEGLGLTAGFSAALSIKFLAATFLGTAFSVPAILVTGVSLVATVYTAWKADEILAWAKEMYDIADQTIDDLLDDLVLAFDNVVDSITTVIDPVLLAPSRSVNVVERVGQTNTVYASPANDNYTCHKLVA